MGGADQSLATANGISIEILRPPNEGASQEAIDAQRSTATADAEQVVALRAAFGPVAAAYPRTVDDLLQTYANIPCVPLLAQQRAALARAQEIP